MRIPAALTATLVALALAACGDDSTSTEPQTTAAQGEEAGTTQSADREPKSKQGSSEGSGKAPSSGSPDTARSANTVPLQVSGGGSAQFRVKGGDNSIEDFGEEGDEAELREAAEVVHDFYVARVSEEWARACSRVARSQVEQLEELAAQSSQLQGKGCAPILAALTQPVSPAQEREITTIDAVSLRHDDEQAFLIYYGAGEAVFLMPMRREDDAWKLTALSSTPVQQ